VAQTNKKVLVVVSLFIVGIMILGIFTGLKSNLPKLIDTFQHLHIQFVVFALICTAIAYLAFTLSFNGLFELTPYKIPFTQFFPIMFISATINFILSSGGWAGVAIRSFLLKQHKVPYSTTIPLSFAQNMIFNLVLAAVSFGGLIYLREHPEFLGGTQEGVVLGFMVGLGALVALMLLVFFHSGFRRWFFKLAVKTANWLSHVILRKKTTNQRLAEIRENLDATIRFFHKGWIQLLVVLFWVCMDWCFTALTLYFCFNAVGVELPLGLLMVGFTVFFLTSTINPIPAGLGVSESALSLVFSLLGVDVNQTVVAALLFRFAFFILPMAVSTALYLDTMRQFLKSQVNENPTGFTPKIH
jgi:glycosyltransferase 2 family protein